MNDMSKPVKCLVTDWESPQLEKACPRPYMVSMQPNGFYVVLFDEDEQGMLFEGPISTNMLEELLNDAYKRGVDDAVEVVTDKLMDLGIC